MIFMRKVNFWVTLQEPKWHTLIRLSTHFPLPPPPSRKPKIAVVDNDYKQVPQPIAKSQKPPRHSPPRDPKTGLFVKINPDRPKPPK